MAQEKWRMQITGYVGTGPGKITLYKEKEVVQRNVPEDQPEAPVDLIQGMAIGYSNGGNSINGLL